MNELKGLKSLATVANSECYHHFVSLFLITIHKVCRYYSTFYVFMLVWGFNETNRLFSGTKRAKDII